MRIHSGSIIATLALVSPLTFGQLGGGSPAVPIPVGDIVFVLDGSGSIISSEFDAFLEAIDDSIGTLIPATKNYRVSVIVFDDEIGTVIPLTFADDPTLSSSILGLVRPSGDTEVDEGLSAAFIEMNNDPTVPDQRAVVLLTDASSGQYGMSSTIADDLRALLHARVSVGIVDTDHAAPSPCDDLSQLFCPMDAQSSVSGEVYEALLVSNAPANPPFVGPLAGTYLPGVIRCIPDSDLSSGTTIADHYTPFFDDALCAIQFPRWVDADSNGVPDICDELVNPPSDCNGNGVQDDCEFVFDCNDNGIFDECEGLSDCDADGIPDICETDCDEDGIPDDCDADVDGDGIIDTSDSVIGPCDGGTLAGPGEPIGG